MALGHEEECIRAEQEHAHERRGAELMTADAEWVEPSPQRDEAAHDRSREQEAEAGREIGGIVSPARAMPRYVEPQTM